MRKQKPFSSALRKSEIRGRKHHDLWLINVIMRMALFCRDKGRCRVDVGALCLSPSCGGDLLASQHTTTNRIATRDKHKAPTLPSVHPLCLSLVAIRFVVVCCEAK